MYEFYMKLIEVEDGDTIRVNIDQGLRDWKHDQSLRIYGISAIEKAKPGGEEAKANLTSLLPVGVKLEMRSYKIDKDPADHMSFERYVVKVKLPDGTDLGTNLITAGWAVYWDGRTKPTPYPAWPRVIPTNPRLPL